MKAITILRNLVWIQSRITVFSALFALATLALHGGGVVTECTESSLRSAMAGGGIVTFACDGTITLSSTITNEVATAFDASGHQITISGGDAVRVFCVTSNGVLLLKNLSIVNGRSSSGAGILNDGGTLTLSNVVMESN